MSKIILFVDDEPSAHDVFELCLLGTDYTILNAYYGKEALQALEKKYQDIDYIFLDMMMPDMTGKEILETMKSCQHYNHIRIIMQSGLASDLNYMIQNDNRISNILVKPYQEQDILRILSSC